ncbi:hypothetical protein Tsubulata_001233, partial [Turnera subulata]
FFASCGIELTRGGLLLAASCVVGGGCWLRLVLVALEGGCRFTAVGGPGVVSGQIQGSGKTIGSGDLEDYVRVHTAVAAIAGDAWPSDGGRSARCWVIDGESFCGYRVCGTRSRRGLERSLDCAGLLSQTRI